MEKGIKSITVSLTLAERSFIAGVAAAKGEMVVDIAKLSDKAAGRFRAMATAEYVELIALPLRGPHVYRVKLTTIGVKLADAIAEAKKEASRIVIASDQDIMDITFAPTGPGKGGN